MKLYYTDDYDNEIYTVISTIVPKIGETVSFRDEEYRIANVIWHIEFDTVQIELTQNTIKVPSISDNASSRLRETNNAIMQVNKRIDATEKNHSLLAEKLSNAKQHFNTTIKQLKKEPS